jgi:hypothetical protein
MWIKIYGTARQATGDNIIRRMRTEFCTTKATDTHPEYVVLTFFSTTTIVAQMRLNVTLYVYCPSCLFIHKYFGGTP